MAWLWHYFSIIVLSAHLPSLTSGAYNSTEQPCSSLARGLQIPNVDVQLAQYVAKGTNLSFPDYVHLHDPGCLISPSTYADNSAAYIMHLGYRLAAIPNRQRRHLSNRDADSHIARE